MAEFSGFAQLQPGVEKVEGGSFDPTKANYTGVSIAGKPVVPRR